MGNTLLEEEFFFDLNNNKTQQISHLYNPEKTLTKSWEYSSRNRLTQLQEDNQKTTRYTYTPDGHLKTLTKPDGITITYTYDGLGRKSSIRTSDGTCHYTLAYNSMDHSTQSKDHIHHATTTRTYNHFGDLLHETLANKLTLDRTYDTLGRKTSLRFANGTSVLYDYDPYHLIAITSENFLHQFTSYDLSHNLLEEELPYNLGLRTHTIDPLNRRISTISPYSEEHIPTIDSNGNILSYYRETEEGEELSSYTYDALDQLLTEEGPFNHTYAYDSHYNRLQKDDTQYELNTLHELFATTHNTYKHDLNGNRISSNNAHYTYDGLDRLIQIHSGEKALQFSYDSWNRCISQTNLILKENTWHSAHPQPFLYDGQNEIGSYPHQTRILAEGHGAEIGAAIAIYQNDECLIPIHDLLGNVIALLDTHGTPQESYRYSAFGEEVTTPYPQNPWRYQSKRKTTHLVNFGRRFYDPETGRWLSPDPKGFSEGPNLYQYLQNSPHLHFDLYGLSIENNNSFANFAKNTWNSPRFQGSLQAIGGLGETFIGGTLALGSYGLAAPAGFAIMAHGLDHFQTGMRSIITNRHTPSLTNSLLQKSGLSPSTSGIIDGTLSIAGTTGGIAALRGASASAFRWPDPSSRVPNSINEKILQPIKTSTRKRFTPNPKATGPHSLFRSDPKTGRITHYETFHPQTNSYDPKPWKSVIRFDNSGLRQSHFNKHFKQEIFEPHIHDPLYPGGVRPAELWEMPK